MWTKYEHDISYHWNKPEHEATLKGIYAKPEHEHTLGDYMPYTARANKGNYRKPASLEKQSMPAASNNIPSQMPIANKGY